jgi:hypothetical protein
VSIALGRCGETGHFVICMPCTSSGFECQRERESLPEFKSLIRLAAEEYKRDYREGGFKFQLDAELSRLSAALQ